MSEQRVTTSESDSEARVHHVPVRRRRGRSRSVMQLNLPAMIDVVFLLLIYFVVTPNFMLDEGVLATHLPDDAEQADALELPAAPMLIELISLPGAGVSIRVSNADQPFTDFPELTRHLQALHENRRMKLDDPIIIRPRGKVRWQHAANALNATIRARYSNVHFAPPEE